MQLPCSDTRRARPSPRACASSPPGFAAKGATGLESAVSAEAEQLHLEDQRGVGRDDPTCALGAVAQLGRNGELALAAHLHGRDAFAPAGDDLALAAGKLEGVAVVARGVELLPVGEPARVMHAHELTLLGGGPGTFHQVLDLQLRRHPSFSKPRAPD